jgi:hypothetical protein
MSYWHRDQNGVAKVNFSNNLVAEIIAKAPGHFAELSYKEGEKTCFILDDDMACEPVKGMVLFFWKGDKLVPD